MNNQKTTGKKILLSGSLVAGAIMGLVSLQTQAAPAVTYTDLGSGAAVRNVLLGDHGTTNALEISCGAKKDSTAKGKSKEHKCGEGKCGEGKCGGKKDKAKDKGGKGKGEKPAKDTTKP